MTDESKSPCWLCGAVERLTSEHVPPRSAFNAKSVTLEQLSQVAIDAGYIAWEKGAEQRSGHALSSLCTKCNHRGGKTLVPSYRDLAHKVAEKVSTRIPLGSIRLESVRNPQLIFRQVLLQFVSTNGASFVAANQWIKPFLLNRKACVLPEDVHLYMFATQNLGMRTTGMGGQILLDKGTFRVLSEFTHWPIGTVLSFMKLDDEPLLPINYWSQIPFNSKKTIDFTLPVNPTVSANPLDFRDDLGIWLDMLKPLRPRPDEQMATRLVTQMQYEVTRRSGRDPKDSILTGRPTEKSI